MIDRRSSGVVNVHTALLAVEMALWWLVSAHAYDRLPGLTFTTLLAPASYPIAISLGVIIGSVRRSDAGLASVGWTESMGIAFRQFLAIAGAVFTVAVGLKDPGISRIFLGAYLATAGMILVLLNRYQPALLVRILFAGRARLPTLILGEAESFPDLGLWLANRQKLGLLPVGVVAYRGGVPRVRDLPVVGRFEDLKEVIARTSARQVLMLSLPHSSTDAEHLARICAACGCRLLIHNNLTFQLTYPLRVLTQDAYSFLTFQDEPLEDPLNRAIKRVVDAVIALPVVILLLPPLVLVVWTFQRLQSPGPIFYRQQRVGRAGRTFWILKFRTMNAGQVGEAAQTARDDIRIFPFGRVLRRISLDELPQFVNVLAGDMSVVGPRPHFVRHDEQFADAVNEYRVRYFVKPGITGLAQSRGFRGAMATADAIRQRIQLDLAYIHSWSVWLDVAIIARTVRQIVRPPPMAQ